MKVARRWCTFEPTPRRRVAGNVACHSVRVRFDRQDFHGIDGLHFPRTRLTFNCERALRTWKGKLLDLPLSSYSNVREQTSSRRVWNFCEDSSVSEGRQSFVENDISYI